MKYLQALIRLYAAINLCHCQSKISLNLPKLIYPDDNLPTALHVIHFVGYTEMDVHPKLPTNITGHYQSPFLRTLPAQF